MISKKLLWMTFILIFLFTSIHINSASSTTYLSVDPQKIINTNLRAGLTFTINIKVTGVFDLYGYEFKLRYNTTVLSATSIVVGSFLLPGYNEWASQINDTGGWLYYSVTQDFGEPSGVNGSGVLATITFLVDGYGYSVIDLYETILGDSRFLPMPHEVIDGYFSNKISGDVNGDKDVDASDLLDLSKAYGSDPLKPSWNAACDFNWDGKVDALDLFALGRNYGKSVP